MNAGRSELRVHRRLRDPIACVHWSPAPHSRHFWGCRTSALNSGHVRLVVAIAGGRSQAVQSVNLVSVEQDTIGGRVLLDAGHSPGARDGSDVIALGEKPRQCDLSGGCSGLGGHRFDLVDDPEIALEVLAHEPWVGLAPVVVRDVVHRANLAGEESVP